MKAKARIASAIALSIPIHTPVSTANAVTLEALCASDDVNRSVLRVSKRLRFPAEAGRLRPDHAYFINDASLMSCTYSLTAGKRVRLREVQGHVQIAPVWPAES